MLKLIIKWQRLLDKAQRTCPRCGETEGEIDKACLRLRESLRPLGIEVILEKGEVTRGDFKKDPLKSNRIWIGERGIEEWLGAKTGHSRCCDLCGDLECRTIEAGGSIYETIPSSLIIKAGLIAAAELLPVEIPPTILTLRHER